MTSPIQSAANYIGVDISGSTIHVALVTEDGRVLERREAALERDAVAAQVARMVAELRDVSPHIAALGVGIPGLVNPRTDRVVISPDLPSVVRGDVHAELIKATGL